MYTLGHATMRNYYAISIAVAKRRSEFEMYEN